MKKKVFAIFACMLLVLGAGCGKKDPAPETPDTDNPAVETELPETLTTEEAKQLYTDAEDIFADISRADFDVDTEATILQDGYEYYRITDDRFESYDDFYRYLNQFFTEDYIRNENLIDDMLFTEGKDGYLYILAAGRGSNIFYAGYAMAEPMAAEDSITVDVTAYYSAEPYEGEIFTEAPENAADFETETYTFKLVPENNTWKFDSFKLFY